MNEKQTSVPWRVMPFPSKIAPDEAIMTLRRSQPRGTVNARALCPEFESAVADFRAKLPVTELAHARRHEAELLEGIDLLEIEKASRAADREKALRGGQDAHISDGMLLDTDDDLAKHQRLLAKTRADIASIYRDCETAYRESTSYAKRQVMRNGTAEREELFAQLTAAIAPILDRLADNTIRMQCGASPGAGLPTIETLIGQKPTLVEKREPQAIA